MNPSRTRSHFLLLITNILLANPINSALADDCIIPVGTLLPDSQTVVPKHLGVQNAHQQEVLRFTNGIANLGSGPLWMEPEFPNDGTPPEDQNQKAFQAFSDAKIIEDSTVPADGIHAFR